MIDADEAQEVHLTVELGGKDPDVLAALARVHGCRFLHVLLDTGTHPSQPMLSWRQAAGIDTALKRAAQLGQALEHQGMKRPSRSRVEAFSLRRESKPKADDRRSRTYGSRAIP
jgi:hypothetical protein